MNDWAAVHRVYSQTRSIHETADVLHMARNTVRNLLKKDELPKYTRETWPSCVIEYVDQIIVWRGEPNFFNGTRIFKELQKIGYTHSIGPVYRVLRKIDEDIDKISSKATVRIETPCGDQAQFDWSEYTMVIGLVEQKVYCFAMILSASRKKAVCFSLKCDADAIYEAIQELFEDLGGVTQELIIDNPKALVLDNDPKSDAEVRYNPHALLLAKHLGTELNACPYYWPRKKGKVENPFRYIEEQFIKGNTFASMEELNREGKAFVNSWCDEVHGTTKRIPNQHYLLEEKRTLLPLPETRYREKELQTRIVSADSLVSIGANKYSVPVQYATKKVKYRLVYGFRIELYDMKDKRIMTWEQEPGKNTVRRLDEHYAPIAKTVSTSIPQIRRDFTHVFSNGQRYLEAAMKKLDQPTHHARKIMLLRDLYDDETLDKFIGYSIAHDKMDIASFKSVLREYNAGRLSLDEKDSTGQGVTGQDNNPLHLPQQEEEALMRECSYYEQNSMPEVKE